MHHTEMKSSHLARASYDPGLFKLQILFHNGDMHEFSNVPPDVHEALTSSRSHGSFFHSKIKGKFESRKIN